MELEQELGLELGLELGPALIRPCEGDSGRRGGHRPCGWMEAGAPCFFGLSERALVSSPAAERGAERKARVDCFEITRLAVCESELRGCGSGVEGRAPRAPPHISPPPPHHQTCLLALWSRTLHRLCTGGECGVS